MFSTCIFPQLLRYHCSIFLFVFWLLRRTDIFHVSVGIQMYFPPLGEMKRPRRGVRYAYFILYLKSVDLCYLIQMRKEQCTLSVPPEFNVLTVIKKYHQKTVWRRRVVAVNSAGTTRAANDGLLFFSQASQYQSYLGAQCELSPVGLKLGDSTPEQMTFSSIPDWVTVPVDCADEWYDDEDEEDVWACSPCRYGDSNCRVFCFISESEQMRVSMGKCGWSGWFHQTTRV